ncbi:MAG: TraR/DksA family transcriptional regulator [Endomicrobia bacterium]|nr:TraR/DksA family transcriptional regulator [Endomicrobiia bacterium]
MKKKDIKSIKNKSSSKKMVKRTNNNKIKFNNKKLNSYKEKLIEKYNEIMRSIKNNNSNNLEIDLEVGDEIDMAENNLGKEMFRELTDTQQQLLDLIITALDRINKGKYGVCLSCGKRIPDKRLRALPWAELCVKCQRIGER